MIKVKNTGALQITSKRFVHRAWRRKYHYLEHFSTNITNIVVFDGGLFIQGGK